jgi:hypothetical protein
MSPSSTDREEAQMRLRGWLAGIGALVVCSGLCGPWRGDASAQPRPPGGAQPARPQAGALPLRSIRLYEVGVGYFERTGRLGSGQALPVPPSHLDDALKSLVVLSKDGRAQVSGIEFASSVSPEMGRALAGLPEGGGPITHHALLRSLEGAGVEVRTAKETVRGRLVDVLEPAESEVTECASLPPAAPGASAEATTARPCVLEKRAALLVLTDRGEVRRLPTSEVIGVRPTDPARAARIGAGLDAVSQGAQAQKRLELLGSTGAEVTLGYVAEAPVWRPTYRMVLDAASDRAVLQGWALIHNDTDDAWRGVKVELVNGKPDSFLFPLAAPRYAHRQLVTPDEPLSSVPQLLGKTVDGWSDSIGDSFGAGGLGLSGVGEGGGGRGEGIGLGTIGQIRGVHAAGSEAPSSLLSIGNLAGTAAATSVEAGALFRYTLPAGLDLRAHGSALVPFLHAPVSARKIAWFAKPGSEARSAARIANETPQTWPAGTVALFADGGFAGEARLGRMKPKEAALLGFGADLDLTLEQLDVTRRDEPRRVAFSGGALTEHFVRHHQVDYALENRSGSARTVMLDLPYVQNAKVEGADELDLEAGRLAVFQIGPRASTPRRLRITEGLQRGLATGPGDWRALRKLSQAPTLDSAQRPLLRAVADALMEAETRRGLIPKRRSDLAEVLADLARLRANHASLRGTDEGEAMAARILHGEDRVRALRLRIEELGVEERAWLERARTGLARLGPA